MLAKQSPVYLVIIAILLISSFAHAKDLHNLKITHANKTIATVKVELATKLEEHALGLMFRKNLPEGEGMWFVFPDDRTDPFWMKNTFIPLDIMFVGKNGKIIDIHENAKPLSENLIYSKKRYRYVLEVPAGFVNKKSVRVGNKISLTD